MSAKSNQYTSETVQMSGSLMGGGLRNRSVTTPMRREQMSRSDVGRHCGRRRQQLPGRSFGEGDGTASADYMGMLARSSTRWRAGRLRKQGLFTVDAATNAEVAEPFFAAAEQPRREGACYPPPHRQSHFTTVRRGPARAEIRRCNLKETKVEGIYTADPAQDKRRRCSTTYYWT